MKVAHLRLRVRLSWGGRLNNRNSRLKFRGLAMIHELQGLTKRARATHEPLKISNDENKAEKNDKRAPVSRS